LVSELLEASRFHRHSDEVCEGGPVDRASGQTDGVLMLAINVSAFCPPAEFLNMIQNQIAHVKSAPPSSGTAEILTPGELEGRTRRQRLGDGIPVEESTWKQLQLAASRLNVALQAF
jgi:LDH2 family malate/lactate/ureidoglycolate dehydrogenase